MFSSILYLALTKSRYSCLQGKRKIIQKTDHHILHNSIYIKFSRFEKRYNQWIYLFTSWTMSILGYLFPNYTNNVFTNQELRSSKNHLHVIRRVSYTLGKGKGTNNGTNNLLNKALTRTDRNHDDLLNLWFLLSSTWRPIARNSTACKDG